VYRAEGRGDELANVLGRGADHFTDDQECKGVTFYRRVERPDAFDLKHLFVFVDR
jgi:hypothetical protein